jgi:hypothetical protein
VAREFTGSEDRAAQLAGQLFDAGGTNKFSDDT